MLTPTSPQTGSLLISEPFMLDDQFRRSVIYLIEHSGKGVMGFIINQCANVVLKQIAPDFPAGNFPVYIGGPVEDTSVHFIHTCYDRLNSGMEISKGVYYGGNAETLKLLIEANAIKENEIRFFLGYSGWKGAQLQTEIEQNSWLISNRYTRDILFMNNEENLWKKLIIDLGPKYAHIANFPENPVWN